MKKYLILFLMFLCSVGVFARNSNISVTKGDTETLVFTFTDSNGDDYSITSNTFYFNAGTTENGSDIISKSDSDFTLSGNDATVELSLTDTDYSTGSYYYKCYFVDGASKKTTVAHGNFYVVNSVTSRTNAGAVIVGTQNINVVMNVAYGTQDAFASSYTAKGDIISGAGAATINVLSVGSNGQLLSADSTQAGGVKWITASGTGDMNTSTYDTDTNGIVDNSERVDSVTHNYTTPADGQVMTYDNASASWVNESIAAAGIVPSADFTTHTGDSTIHFIEGSIDHTIITNIGTNSHAAIDTHIASANIHYQQSAISIPASQVSDFDTEVANNSAVAANTAKTTNQTHTGDVTGATALTLQSVAITGQGEVTAATDDYILISDTSDSASLKKSLISSLPGGGSGITSFDVAGDTGSFTITSGNTLSIVGVDGISTIAGSPDTVTISAVEAEIDHDSLLNFASNEHFTQAAISITESQISDLGTYQDQAANLTSISGLTPASSLIIGNGLGGFEMVTPANFITNNNIYDSDSDVDHDQTTNFVAGEHFLQSEITTVGTITTGTWNATPITTLGTVTTGTWNATAISDAYIEHAGVTDNPHQTIVPIVVACSGTTSTFSATTLETFRIPHAFTITDVRSSLTTAATGSAVSVNITESGTTIFSTQLSIDTTEKTSTTAAVGYVLSDSSLADDAEIKIICSQADSNDVAAGLKVTIKGYAGN